MADHPSGLESLGFTDRFRASFEPYAAQGLVPARIAHSDGRSALVLTGSGPLQAEECV